MIMSPPETNTVIQNRAGKKAERGRITERSFVAELPLRKPKVLEA